jgi:hypothetical protein
MEMTKYAKAIKAELAMELSKQGSSLAEFEAGLATLNTGEGVLKIANEGSKMLQGYMNKGLDFGVGTMSSIPEMALKGSLAGGAMAGLTLDEMDQSVDSINKALAKEREKIHLVRRVTENLKREHGIY